MNDLDARTGAAAGPLQTGVFAEFGTPPARFGYSHFVRMPALDRVAQMVKAMGSLGEVTRQQVGGLRMIQEAKESGSNSAAKKAVHALKDMVQGLGAPEVRGGSVASVARWSKEDPWYEAVCKYLGWSTEGQQVQEPAVGKRREGD